MSYSKITVINNDTKTTFKTDPTTLEDVSFFFSWNYNPTKECIESHFSKHDPEDYDPQSPVIFIDLNCDVFGIENTKGYYKIYGREDLYQRD
jgi:hypothetical protein